MGTEHPRAALQSSLQERRVENRLPVALHIRYCQNGSDEIHHGEMFDLNMKGAGLRSTGPLPVGSRVILEIRSPDGRTTRCPAEILYSRRVSTGAYASGSRFLDLNEGDLKAIRRILRVEAPHGVGKRQRPTPAPSDLLHGLRSGMERRRTSRFRVDRSIAYKIFGSGGKVEAEGVAQIIDVSLTGVGLRTSAPVLLGVSLQIEVVYSGGLRSTIEAESIYCRRDGENLYTNGLRFTAIERSDLTFFSRLLAG